MWKQILKLILKKEAIRLSIQVCIILLSLFNTTLLVASGIWRDSFQSLTEIGRGTLKVFIWEVYDLTLLSETKSFSWQDRFVLEFDYKLELKKDEVIKASIKEMRHQRSINNQALAKWQKYLERGIEPVEKGTRAAVEWLPEGKIAFHYDDQAPVIIDDELFARSFISIWLGQETSKPELRAALLGRGQ